MTLKKYWFLLKTCHSNQSLTAYWPKNWRETEQLLMECGYKEPKEFTICLDQSHPCHWDVIDSPSATCRHCGKSGNIKYYYLGLSQKIKTWFSDPSMCEKMLAHWVNREAWISGIGPNWGLQLECCPVKCIYLKRILT